MFFIICNLVPETPTCHACHGSFYTFQYVCISINNFNFIQQRKIPFRNGAIKTITYGRMYIGNGMTFTTMNVIGAAGWKKKTFLKAQKSAVSFFMFYNSEFPETYIDY